MCSSVSDVNEWMRRSDDLVSEITNLVAFNDPANTTNCNPNQVDEIRRGVVELGYNDVNEFCVSFPTKFIVHAESGVISLHNEEKSRVFKRFEEEKQERERRNQLQLDHMTMDALSSLFPGPPPPQENMVKTEENEESQMQSVKKGDRIHFKISHEGKTRRFAISRYDSNLVGTVKQRVENIIGCIVSSLSWRDEDSLCVLEDEEDMFAAIHYAETYRKPVCILIEATIGETRIDEEMGSEQVGVEESVAIPVEESRESIGNIEMLEQKCSELSIAETIRQVEYPEDSMKEMMEQWRKRDEETLRRLEEIRAVKELEKGQKGDIHEKHLLGNDDESPEEKRLRNLNKTELEINEDGDAMTEMKKSQEEKQRKKKERMKRMEARTEKERMEKEKKDKKMRRQELWRQLLEIEEKLRKGPGIKITPLRVQKDSKEQRKILEETRMKELKQWEAVMENKRRLEKEKEKEAEEKSIDSMVNLKTEVAKMEDRLKQAGFPRRRVDSIVEKIKPVLESMQMLENQLDNMQLQPATAAPIAPDATAAASVGPDAPTDAAALLDDVASRRQSAQDSMREVLRRKEEENERKKLELSAIENDPESMSFHSKAEKLARLTCSWKKNERDYIYPAESWLSYEEFETVTEKFLRDREEFIMRGEEIMRIPAHLEQNLLKEMMDHTSVDALPKRLHLLQILVHNNIRMHVFQEHEVMFTENKEVENEMIRVIATDLASRLEKMRNTVKPVPPLMCERLIQYRIDELERELKNTPTPVMGCRFAALNMRLILTTSVYKISYEPNEIGYEGAFDRASEFTVQLKMIANEKKVDVEEKKEETMLDEKQQELLNQLFNTGIFQDFDKMVEVCLTARNLEQAIDMMIKE
ncbi:hypothetical protein PENTCL1PPCAC_1693 [Pristionchus entomophagus]|uniref:UBA domain-containing protein n=1 Tax=Pristionchus entomophagus TaxID=358040 RepID=A0AAV5S9K6_9BILA|nr:hypothetical protein PENTCL1PPCAC_1693 [Pristionchus entomophagus]